MQQEQPSFRSGSKMRSFNPFEAWRQRKEPRAKRAARTAVAASAIIMITATTAAAAAAQSFAGYTARTRAALRLSPRDCCNVTGRRGVNIHEEREAGGEIDAPLEGSSAGLFPLEARGNCAVRFRHASLSEGSSEGSLGGTTPS